MVRKPTLPTYEVIRLICIAQFRDSRNRIEMATTFELTTINLHRHSTRMLIS